MSWHYLQGREVVSWAGTSLVGAPYALWKLMPIAEESSLPDNETEHLSLSRSGTTSERSTDTHGKGISTSSQGDSPAKTSAQRVKVQDLPESVRAFGSRCCELLEKCGLVLSSRKTVRSCVPVDLAPSSKDLPAWGMTCGGACWELGTSARLTEGIGSGYLPTPTAMDHRDMSTDAVAVAQARGQQVRPAGRVKMLPTPSASSYGTNCGGAAGRTGKVRPSLETMARRNTWPTPTANRRSGLQSHGRNSILGRLNPTWVEWLMGWPLGWTDLKPLEMDKFRQWLRSHGRC